MAEPAGRASQVCDLVKLAERTPIVCRAAVKTNGGCGKYNEFSRGGHAFSVSFSVTTIDFKSNGWI